ncbi:hypothetical protein EGW08_002557 [Elysia chlorotica]|uniref:Glycosyltransferase family 92 protein n=1 Tax=Elysia chlorotica TaxID=188477 RepID=A0A3S0ZZ88_ELYCH|nr:hypothetical protein EGW08_002557 [Elysia chlorotica]
MTRNLKTTVIETSFSRLKRLTQADSITFRISADEISHRFLPVEISRQTFYVYSAFHVEGGIRIIALKKRNEAITRLYCAVWYNCNDPTEAKSGKDVTVVAASVRNLHDHHGLDYTAAFILCPLKQPTSSDADTYPPSMLQKTQIQDTPLRVSLIDEGEQELATLVELPIETDEIVCRGKNENKRDASAINEKLDIGKVTKNLDLAKTPKNPDFVKTPKNPDFAKTTKNPDGAKITVKPSVTETTEISPDGKVRTCFRERVEFTVCSSVLHSMFSRSESLVETVEMSRLLGAGRVVFYNASISADVNQVLGLYAQDWSEGREALEVVVLPWDLPKLLSPDKLYQFGKMAAINDCLHRYRNSSRYIVFSDLDEFIMPIKFSSWSELIAQVNRAQPGTSEYLFQRTIFRRQRPSLTKDFHATAEEYNPAILGVTQREDYIFPQKIRSRMIVDPVAAKEIGLHFAWRILGKSYNVSTEDGLVHDYKETTLNGNIVIPNELSRRNTRVTDMYVANRFGLSLATRLKTIWSRLKREQFV